jgi:hypothetical protein
MFKEIFEVISNNDLLKLKSFKFTKENVNKRDSLRGATLLHWAAFHQNLVICQFLSLLKII